MKSLPSIELLPLSPKAILAMIQSVESFEAEIDRKTLAELRDFFVCGDVSPEWLKQLESATVRDTWTHGFAVVDVEKNLVVGTAGFKGPPDEIGIVEIAYAIVPSYQGRGLATAAACALIDLAQTDNQVRYFRAHTAPESNASTSILKKLGFEFMGQIHDPQDGSIWRWQRAASSTQQ
jgi:[ribosomal protein S5]-alanine N-acetyltransferase